MSNWSQAQKFLSEYDAGKTIGSSMKENARYIDSVQGKLTLLQEKWRDLVNTLVDGNTAKQVLDIAINIVGAIDNIVKGLDDMGIALPTVIGLIVGLKNGLKFNANGGFEELINQERKLTLEAERARQALQQQAVAQAEASGAVMTQTTNPGFIATIKEGWKATSLYKSWTVIKKIGTSFKEAHQSSGLFSSGLTAVRESLGSVEAKALGTKVAIGAMNIAMTAFSMVGNMLLFAGISKGLQMISDKMHETEDAIESSTEKITSYKTSIEGLQNKRDTLSELVEQYDELANKTNRTKEEEEEFINLRKQIAGMDDDWVAGYDENNNPILKINESAKELVDTLDLALDRKERLLNQENRKLGNDSTTWMGESAGWNKGQNKDKAVKALKDANIAITNQIKTNSLDYKNSFLGFMSNYKNSLSQLEKTIADGASKVQDAYAEVQEQNQNIINGVLADFANDEGWKKLDSKIQGQITNIVDTFDFSQLTSGDKLSFSNAMEKMFDTGQIDEALTKYKKLRDELIKTGDTFTYQKELNKLVPDLSNTLGVSEDVVKQLTKIPENLKSAQSALDLYLMSFNKRESMQSFDKETASLVKTYETYRDMLLSLGDLESKKVNGKQVWEIEPVLDIVNKANLPQELDDLINDLLSDNECDVDDMKLIVDIAKAYTTTDKDTREELMNAVQNEINKKFPDKKIDVGDFKLKANFSVDKSSQEDINNAFQSFDQFKGKESIVAVIKPQVYNTDQVEAYANLLDRLHGSDKDIETFLKANIEDLASCESYQEMVEWLFNHSEIMTKYNINVLGEDTIIQAKNAVDSLLNSKDEKDIRVKIDNALQNGDIQALESALSEIPPEKRIQVLAEIGNAMDSLGTVDALQLKDKMVTLYAEAYEAWAMINQIEGKNISDKNFTLIANSNIADKIAEINKKVANLHPTFTITGFIQYSESKGSKGKRKTIMWDGRTDSIPHSLPITDRPVVDSVMDDYSNQIATFDMPITTFDMPISTQPVVTASSTSSDSVGISAYSSRDFNSIGDIETAITPISLKYQDVLDMIEYSVELFKELQYRIETVTKKTSLLDKQMEKAIGTEKIKYLEQKNKLLEEQAKLQKEYYDDLISERDTLQQKLQKEGFNFNEDGNMTNYEEKLLAMQKEYKRLQDIADKASKNSSSKSSSKSSASQSASDKASEYKEELDKLTNLANKYYDIQQSELFNCEEQWSEMKTTIKENNDEIEKLTREDKLYRFNNAITKLNNQFDILGNKIDIIDVKLENSNGLDTIKLTEEKLKLMNEQLSKQMDLINNMKNKIPVYQENLSKYGFTFDIEGNVNNIDDILNSFQNNEDLEKVNDLLEEYTDLINGDLADAEKNYANLQKDIVDLQKDKLNKVKDIEDKITDVIKDEIDKRKDAIEKQYDKERELIENKRDAYKKQRDEDDYAKDLKEQQDKIDGINKKIELAKRDNSMSGKSKLKELLDELKEAQDDLNDKIQSKTDSDIDDMFQSQLDALDKKKEDMTQDIDNTYTQQKIAQMVQDAMMTNTFTDLNGNITNLQDKLIDFAEKSGDAVGILGDSIKTELCDNLSVALDYLKDYSEIFDQLGFKQLGNISYKDNLNKNTGNKTLNVGDIVINIDGNVDDNTLDDMQDMINKTLQDIVNKSL